MTDGDIVARYLGRVADIAADDARLSPLAAGILAAAELGIATDSTAFCRALGISHALALREIDVLGHDLGLIRITGRNQRTGRTFYELQVTETPGESTYTYE